MRFIVPKKGSDFTQCSNGIVSINNQPDTDGTRTVESYSCLPNPDFRLGGLGNCRVVYAWREATQSLKEFANQFITPPDRLNKFLEAWRIEAETFVNSPRKRSSCDQRLLNARVQLFVVRAAGRLDCFVEMFAAEFAICYRQFACRLVLESEIVDAPRLLPFDPRVCAGPTISQRNFANH